MTEIASVLAILADHDVACVIIGGVAATVHGSALLTYDVDVCYDRRKENVARLVAALGPHHPRLRDVPPEVPFVFDERTVLAGMNFTLTIDLGSIDLIGEVPGLGRYDEVLAHAERMRLFSRQFPVLSLDALITAKKATGRAKDMIAAQELEAIREKLKGTGQ